MVDSIKGSGGKIFITTKPPAKDNVDRNKAGDFEQAIKNKGTAGSEGTVQGKAANPADNNLRILHQQQLANMQRLEEIAKQIKSGTYQMVDPAVLAEKLFQLISDKKTRQKFIKKLLEEEMDGLSSKDKPLSDLELKKLVYLIKETQDEDYDDPELEELLKEFS